MEKAEKSRREALCLLAATLLALALLLVAALLGFAPLWGETGAGAPPALEDSVRVDLNHGDLYDLCRLPGVGAATAYAILEYRAWYGPLESAFDLEGVGGLDALAIIHWGNMAYTAEQNAEGS